MSYSFLWLISFSIIPSRSSHVGTSGKISFFFNGWVQFSSVAQKCPTLCDPMNCSMPGLPVHHQLPELTQTHVHWVSDAIQPSHPLSSPSPPTFNLSQHQGLFKWVSSSHQVAKVLQFQLQHLSFQWTPRADLLQNGLVESTCSPRDSQEFSRTPQFKSINSLMLSFLYSPTLTSIHDCWKTIPLIIQTFIGKVMFLLFNMLSRFVIAFLPKSKNLLTSWLQSPSAVILDPKKIVSHCFHCFPIYFLWSDGTRCHDLHFLNVEL